MSTKAMIICLLVVFLGVGACAVTGGSKEKKLRMQEAFDPRTLEDDDILTEFPYPDAPGSAQPSSDLAPGTSTEQPPPEDSSAPSIGHKQVQGYRVQIFASQDRAKAEEMKRKATATFNIPIYVDFEPPWYKVRGGDYETEEEARAMLEKIKTRGYEWRELTPLVVRSYIWKE